MKKQLSISQTLKRGLGSMLGLKGFSFDAGSVVIGGDSRPLDYTPARAAAEANKQAVVASCISAWLREYPQPAFVVMDADGQPDYEHIAMTTVLARPNEWMGQSEFKTLAMFYRLLTGTAYIHKVRNRHGIPIALDLYHAGNMRPVSTRDRRIDHYALSMGLTSAKIPVEDVIRLPWFVRSVDNPVIGVSPLRLCFNDIATYSEVGDFVYSFLKKGGVPGTIVTVEDGFTGSDDQVRQDKRDFEEKFSGPNRFSVAWLTGKTTVQSFAHGLKDINTGDLRDTPEANICAAFSVPPELIGVSVGLKSSTYSNKAEARRAFTQSVLASVWASDAEAIGSSLMADFGNPDYTIQYDTSDVPAMQEDAKAVSERARAEFNDNLITRDEARAMLRRDPVDNGAAVFASTLREPKPIGKRMKAIGDDTDEERKNVALFKRAVKNIDDSAETLEAIISGKLTDLHRSLRSELGSKSAKRGVPQSITMDALRKLFIEGTKRDREEMVKKMVDEAASMADFDPLDIADWLKGALKEGYGVSSEKVEESLATIRDEVLETINGKTGQELADALESLFTKQLNRAATIARANATSSNSASAERAWSEINSRRTDGRIIGKRWLSERDGDVRESHHEADGQEVEVGKDFVVGRDRMKGPGLGQVAEENIGCRCVPIPVTRKAA